MEIRVEWSEAAKCYIVYANKKEAGRAPDIAGVRKIIQFLTEK